MLTELVTNNAVAVVVTPIASGLAGALGLDPRPLVIAVMIAASAAFSTPIGYQTYLLVYGPGGYKFSDFLKVWTPLNLSIGLLALTAFRRALNICMLSRRTFTSLYLGPLRILSAMSCVIVLVIVISLLPYCLSSTTDASEGSVTHIMKLTAASGRTGCTIAIGGLQFPSIALKSL